MKNSICVIDFETTGLDPKLDRPMEVAVELWELPKRGTLGKLLYAEDTLLNPGRECSIEARAIHHIGPEEVKDKPTWEEYCEELLTDVWDAALTTGDADVYLCAHNAPFDKAFFWLGALGLPEVGRWIDTRLLAYHLLPDCPRYNNQYLRYYLELDVSTGDIPPHRAAADVLVTSAILCRLLEIASRREDYLADPLTWLLDYSDPGKHPLLYKSFSFGKHKDLPMNEVPYSYLQWLSSQADFNDSNAINTATQALKGIYHPSLTKRA